MEIKEEIHITDLETLKVISDPLRVQILERIGLASDAGRSTTVKQLSEDLDIPPTKLYYHIKLLERHELILVAETRVVSGIIEKHYQVRARRIRVDLNISKNTEMDRDEGLALTLSSIATMFDTAYKNLEASFQHHLQEADSEDEQTTTMLSFQAMLQLSLGQAAQFVDQLNELIDQYAQIHHPDGLVFGLTIVFNPNYHITTTGAEESAVGMANYQNPLLDMDKKGVHIPPQL